MKVHVMSPIAGYDKYTGPSVLLPCLPLEKSFYLNDRFENGYNEKGAHSWPSSLLMV